MVWGVFLPLLTDFTMKAQTKDEQLLLDQSELTLPFLTELLDII